MPRTLPSALLILLLWVLPSAQPRAGALEAGGMLLGDLRLNTGEDSVPGDFSRRELRLDLYASATPSEDSRLRFQGWIRSLDFPVTPESLEDLAASPFPPGLYFELKEAFADLYGFPLAAMDTRLGRQRIAWGRADKISVVDNLNPDDLEDPWDFGRHLSSDALKLTWYVGSFTVQGVYIPFFTPARLGAETPVLSSLPPGSTLSFTPLPRADSWDGTCLGLRVSLLLAGWDVACAYVYGRDDMFTVTRTLATGLPPAPLELTAAYLRQQVLSVELSGMLGGLGLWAEAALFVPEKQDLVTDLTAAFGPLSRETTRIYLKLLAGLDTTFRGGVYLNVQILHGLFSENGRDELGNYLLVGLEWPLPGGRVRLGPLGLALEIDDLENPDETWALIVNPELSIVPADGAALILGARAVAGREQTRFGLQKDDGEVYARCEFSF